MALQTRSRIPGRIAGIVPRGPRLQVCIAPGGGACNRAGHGKVGMWWRGMRVAECVPLHSVNGMSHPLYRASIAIHHMHVPFTDTSLLLSGWIMRRVMRGHKMESSTCAQPYGQAHCMAHCTAMYIAPVHIVEHVSISALSVLRRPNCSCLPLPHPKY